MGRMKALTIKIPEPVVRQLKEQAERSGRSVAALVRERIEAVPAGSSVYAITADIAGSVAGNGLPTTNARRRFRRS